MAGTLIGPTVWAAGAFFISFFLPIINGSSQAIWQAKVAPDVQGRVFSVRRQIFLVTVVLGAAAALAGNLVPIVRNVETLLPYFERAPSPVGGMT